MEKKYCCQNCKKTLFFGNLIEGVVSKDCPRCGERNVFIAERKTVERFDTVKKPNQMNTMGAERR